MYIFQISDFHFQIENERSVANLQKVLKSINEQDIRPDIILITGDITHQQEYASYQEVFKLLSTLGAPVYCITGNNDSSSGLMRALREYLPQHPQSEMTDALQYVVDDYPFQIITLDSFAENMTSGEVDKERLNWLEQKLINNSEHKPVLVMVHQFTAPNALNRPTQPWFEAFNRIIAEHRDTVKLVVSGHLHASLSASVNGVRFISAFSTNWNSILDFKDHGNDIRDYSRPVGYLIHYFNNGEFSSYQVVI